MVGVETMQPLREQREYEHTNQEQRTGVRGCTSFLSKKVLINKHTCPMPGSLTPDP